MSEKAYLVTLVLQGQKWSDEELEAELRELASSAGAQVVSGQRVQVQHPQAKLFIGSGQAERVGQEARRAGAGLVIFSHDLASSQQQQLEEIIGVKTLDRTQLILDIFARRAHSREGKLQVELAQLEYLLPRLSGKGIFLSRLGGGIGTRGPGETKLETDKRRIRDRIVRLKKELAEIKERRDASRGKRRESEVPIISIVGYTNAGKSSLFNCLSQAHTHVENKLFSTLDPLIRKVKLPNHQSVLLVDTVGFLNDLPHHLIEAFQSTLEEAVESDLLIEVIDASSSRQELHRQSVQTVLKELGADRLPRILVWNKMDLIPAAECRAKTNLSGEWEAHISCKEKKGLEALFECIERELESWRMETEVLVPAGFESLIPFIYQSSEILSKEILPEGTRFKIRVPYRARDHILSVLKRGKSIGIGTLS